MNEWHGKKSIADWRYFLKFDIAGPPPPQMSILSNFSWDEIVFFYLLLLFSTRVLPSRYTTGYLQSFTVSFYSKFCGVREEYRQIYFPWASSWSAWKMRVRKFVMLTVFMWNCIFVTKAYKPVSSEAQSAIVGIMPIEQAMQLHRDEIVLLATLREVLRAYCLRLECRLQSIWQESGSKNWWKGIRSTGCVYLFFFCHSLFLT